MKEDLQKEVDKAQEELKELEGFFEAAEEAKNDWIAKDEKLRAIVEGNADKPDKDQSKKDEDQQNLEEHQLLKQDLIDAYDEKMRQRDEKIDLINEAARLREEERLRKEKEKGDAAYWDLEGLKMDQEGQVQGLQGEVDYWQGEMFRVLEEGDYDAFVEFHGYKAEADKKLQTAQAKLDKTVVDFEVEKAAKEKRDRDEEVAIQTAEFERRSGERKEQYDEINGRLQTAL